MAIKLPKDKDEAEAPKRKVTPKKTHREEVEPLLVGDTIEYGITMEVSPGPGRKAWIKAGTTSSVRDGESTEAAKVRVTRWVEGMLDERLDELS